VDVRCLPLDSDAAPTVLPAIDAGPVPVHGALPGQAPEIMVDHANTPPLLGVDLRKQLLARLSRGRFGSEAPGAGGGGECTAYISTADLINTDDDELHLQDCIRSDRLDEADESEADRFLHVGARACHVPHRMGSSLLLTLSPRFVLLNRTGGGVEYRQSGCGADTGFLVAPAAEADAYAVLHWQDAHLPKLLELRRSERGAEWSGSIPVTDLMRGALSNGTELTLRLRNLQEGSVEFVRLVAQRLENRGTVVLSLAEQRGVAPPILVQNLTKHEARFQQAGVPIVCAVSAGSSFPYAWDEPGGAAALAVDLPSVGVRFQCRAVPSRMERPRLARLLRRPYVELQVAAVPVLRLPCAFPAPSPCTFPEPSCRWWSTRCWCASCCARSRAATRPAARRRPRAAGCRSSCLPSAPPL